MGDDVKAENNTAMTQETQTVQPAAQAAQVEPQVYAASTLCSSTGPSFADRVLNLGTAVGNWLGGTRIAGMNLGELYLLSKVSNNNNCCGNSCFNTPKSITINTVSTYGSIFCNNIKHVPVSFCRPKSTFTLTPSGRYMPLNFGCSSFRLPFC